MLGNSHYAKVYAFAGSGCETASAPYPNPFPRFTQEKGQMHETLRACAFLQPTIKQNTLYPSTPFSRVKRGKGV